MSDDNPASYHRSNTPTNHHGGVHGAGTNRSSRLSFTMTGNGNNGITGVTSLPPSSAAMAALRRSLAAAPSAPDAHHHSEHMDDTSQYMADASHITPLTITSNMSGTNNGRSGLPSPRLQQLRPTPMVVVQHGGRPLIRTTSSGTPTSASSSGATISPHGTSSRAVPISSRATGNDRSPSPASISHYPSSAPGSRRGSSSTPRGVPSNGVGRQYNPGLYDHNEDTPSPLSARDGARDSPLPSGSPHAFDHRSNSNNNNSVDMRRRAIAQNNRSPVSARINHASSPSDNTSANRMRAYGNTTGISSSSAGGGTLFGRPRWPIYLIVTILVVVVMVLLRQRSNMIRSTGSPAPPLQATEPSGASSYTTSGGRGRTPSKPSNTNDGTTTSRTMTYDEALPELERVRTRMNNEKDDINDNDIIATQTDHDRTIRSLQDMLTATNNDISHASSSTNDVISSARAIASLMTSLQSSIEARDKLSSEATAALVRVKDINRQSEQATDTYRKAKTAAVVDSLRALDDIKQEVDRLEATKKEWLMRSKERQSHQHDYDTAIDTLKQRVVHAEVAVEAAQTKVNRQRDNLVKIGSEATLCDSNFEAHSKEISQSILDRASANEILQQQRNEHDTQQAKLESSRLSITQLSEQQTMFKTLLDKLDHGGDASAARHAFTPKTDQLDALRREVQLLHDEIKRDENVVNTNNDDALIVEVRTMMLATNRHKLAIATKRLSTLQSLVDDELQLARDTSSISDPVKLKAQVQHRLVAVANQITKAEQERSSSEHAITVLTPKLAASERRVADINIALNNEKLWQKQHQTCKDTAKQQLDDARVFSDSLTITLNKQQKLLDDARSAVRAKEQERFTSDASTRSIVHEGDLIDSQLTKARDELVTKLRAHEPLVAQYTTAKRVRDDALRQAAAAYTTLRDAESGLARHRADIDKLTSSLHKLLAH